MSEKMDMGAFADYVETHIGEYLPEEFKGARIRCSIVDKPGYYHLSEDSMMGLMVLKPGANIAPVVYLKKYHEEYLDGRELGSVLARIAEQSRQEEMPFTREEINAVSEIINASPETFLSMVRPRLCPKERVPDAFVSTSFLDLAEVYYISFEGKDVTCSIRKAFLEKLGLTAGQVAEAARVNLRKEPPALYKMMDIQEAFMSGHREPENLLAAPSFQGAEPKLPPDAQNGRTDLFVLTNKERFYGAAFLADQDLQERLFKAIGAYYVLPSSIHEVILLPQAQAAASITEREMRDMVREVNNTQVAENEILSGNIYVNRGEGIKPVFGEQICRENKVNRHRKR